MQQHWWGINIFCNDCEVECLVESAFCSADGEIMFLANCPKCYKKVKWTTTPAKLAYIALRNDMEATEKEQPQTRLQSRKPVRPPLQLPRVDEHLTVNDAKWLKEMNVDPEEGNLQ